MKMYMPTNVVIKVKIEPYTSKHNAEFHWIREKPDETNWYV